MYIISRANLLVLFLLASAAVAAQVVTTNPPFPLTDQSVTISFDARLGSGGLENHSGDVYAHTGVITSESTGSSDWKYVKTAWGENTPDTKLTRTGQNSYFLSVGPSIREYYGVPESEEIEMISLVFRSGEEVNGSYLEGKTSSGGDIFVTVYEENPGLVLQVESPQVRDQVIPSGETIPIVVQLSDPAEINIEVDGSTIQSGADVSSLNANHTAELAGNHTIVITASNGSTTIADTFYYSIQTILAPADLPANSQNGLTYLSDNSVRLVLEAPGKDHCIVRGSFDDFRFRSENTMTPTPDGNYFWIEINNLDSGAYYTYQYLVDLSIPIADPYSETILDPVDDPFLDLSDWEGLPDFPSNASSNVSLFQAGGYNYAWQHDDFNPPNSENLIVYELLMRDFLGDHSYTSLLDTLDYLERLGINAIELMPVNEYEGNIGWGYNPSFHMALDKYYGNPYEFKAFIDEAHRRGIAVILDVVYNHAFSQSPLAQLYWDANNFRPAPNNPWLNPVARHPFNVGYDFNHESALTRNWVKRVTEYWLQEYDIDGFRFDLSKGFTQTLNTDVGAWGQYDAGRIAILKEYADHVWSVNPETYFILEHFADNDEEVELANYGMLIWGNMHFNFKDAALGFNANTSSNFGWANYENRGWDEPNIVVYMESHDEERLMYENLNFGNSDGSYDVKDFATSISRIGMCHTFLTAFPGPKMIWEFGELGYDFSINRCDDGSIDGNCRLTPKPIRWDYVNNQLRQDLFTTYQDLHDFKKTFLMGGQTSNQSLTGDLKSMTVRSDSVNLFLVGNFGVKDRTGTIIIPNAGTWYDFFSGDSIVLNNNVYNANLDPGEYHMYTSQRVTRISETMSGINLIESADDAGIVVFPNPARLNEIISIQSTDIDINEIYVLNNIGQLVSVIPTPSETFRLSNLSTGNYTLILVSENKAFSSRIIMQE